MAKKVTQEEVLDWFWKRRYSNESLMKHFKGDENETRNCTPTFIVSLIRAYHNEHLPEEPLQSEPVGRKFKEAL